MLIIICWTKPVSTLQNSTMSFQHYACCQGACINPYKHTLSSCLVMHQSRRVGSSWCTLMITLAIIFLRWMSFSVSPHPIVTAVAHLFYISIAAQRYPKTGKCPTNFPQIEKTFQMPGVLLDNLKDSSFFLTSSADIMFVFTYISS